MSQEIDRKWCEAHPIFCSLKQIHWNYQQAYEMCQHVNKIFGLSHLALILMTFHSSVTCLNLIYRQIVKNYVYYDVGKIYRYFIHSQDRISFKSH